MNSNSLYIRSFIVSLLAVNSLLLSCAAPAPGANEAQPERSLVSCPTTFKGLETFPSDREPGWSNELNGVADDDSANWFFTQDGKLWKFPVARDLNAGTSGPNPDQGILRVSYSEVPSLKAYAHLGDLDYYNGYLYVPIEDNHSEDGTLPPGVAIFRADDLSFVAQSTLNQKASGWVAINPRDELLYSSNDNVSASEPIFKYEVDFNRLEKERVLSLTSAGKLIPRDGEGNPLTLKMMQGGVFSKEGCFFALSGYYKGPGGRPYDEAIDGIHVIDPDSGTRIVKSWSNSGPGNLRYIIEDYGEEPEGITIWDLDSVSETPLGGQLHAIMLDNMGTGDDDFYFRHYGLSNYADRFGRYKVVVKTSCVDDADTDDDVRLWIQGDQNKVEDYRLDIPGDYDDRESCNEDAYPVFVWPYLGNITSVSFELHGNDHWLLKYATIKDVESGTQWRFDCDDKFIGPDRPSNSIVIAAGGNCEYPTSRQN